MLIKLLREQRAQRVVCVFDAPGKTFRAERYPGYKAHRPPLPDDLRAQLPYIRRIVEAMRVPIVEIGGVEADDVIATLAKQAEAHGVPTVVVTADKDLMQIVSDHVTLYDEMRDRRIGPAEVEARFGVAPERVPDVLGLVGDTSDAIPGVAGIGEKTAAVLVASLGSIDSILGRIEEVEALPIRGAKRVRERLEEGADVARLSRDLATVRRDVPVTLDLAEVEWQGPNQEAIRPLLEELEFTQLARELAPDAGATSEAAERVVVSDVGEVEHWVERLSSAEAIAVGVGLDGPRPTAAGLRAIALWPGRGPVVTLREPTAEMLAALRPLLESQARELVGGDLKSARVALARRGVGIGASSFDTELASYCLDPSRPTHDPVVVARDELGFRAPAGDEAVEVAANRAEAAWRLRPVLAAALDERMVAPLFRDLESPLAEVLARMELEGIALDTEALGVQSRELAGELATLLKEIHELAGGEFNVGSPPQLRDVLFDRLGLPTKGVKRTKTGYSTDVDVLTKLAALHPLPAKILEYRSRAKLKSTYVDALPGLVDPSTGRLHTTFNQTVAATGRLSSSDPNLQNIPIRTEEGRRIRRAFIAAKGCRLVSADYSQVELRVLAHLSGDAGLIAAFRSGEDIHARTAADVFGDRSPSEGRRLAKVINYGILYGMGPVRAARELGVTVKQAAGFIEEWFDRYEGVRRFLDATLEAGRRQGYVTTLLGRRRYLPELRSEQPSVRQFAERAAVNTPVQGSAADLIKLAMLEVDGQLRGMPQPARMLLQVHDELLVEASVAGAEAVADVVATCMRGIWSLEVPLEVDVAIGESWADVH